MKTKTKKKQVKDLLYPCYFTIARPQFEEGVHPTDTIRIENQSLLENNEYFRIIQEQNEKVLQEFMSKTDAEVPDEDFFDLLRYDPVILGSRFGQEKISRWRGEMYDDDGIVSYNAESKLKRISPELARKGTDSPAVVFQVAFFRDYFKEYIDNTGDMSAREEFIQALEEALGVDIRNDNDIARLYVDIDYDRKNLPKLLNLTIAKVTGLRESTVRQYLKQVIDVYENGQKIGYAIEVTSSPRTKSPG